MASLKQIEANRLNARKSTGPRSAEGKAVTRFNALKSGIDAKSAVIIGEDPGHLQDLSDEYYQRWQPTTPEQRCLVDILVTSEWLLRRLRHTETQIWDAEIESLTSNKEGSPLGNTYYRHHDVFNRLQRRIDSTDRSYHRALKELRRLRSEPAPPALGPEHLPDLPAPAPSAVTSQDARPVPTSQFGFVPSQCSAAALTSPLDGSVWLWGRMASCARVVEPAPSLRRLAIGAQVNNLPHKAN